MAPEDPASPEPVPADDETSAVVTRTVDVDAAPADVWQAVADPAERALWLDDPEALGRHVRVDESSPGHRLVWTWWRPGDEGDASTVSVVLAPVDGGGTRVVVTESVPAPTPVGASLRHASLGHASLGHASLGHASLGHASARVGTAPIAAGGSRRAPAWLRCAGDRWDSRLLGLELLFVAARVAVA